MPARNAIKQYVPDSYYHMYARGVDRALIFQEDHDYTVFLGLLKRYLSAAPSKNENGIPYPHLYNQLELLAFCLLPNHFHLLVYQEDTEAMQQLMRGVMTSYSMYFNTRYKRSGPLFEGRYKASRIDSEQYLMHISRYIHLNPPEWQTYEFSSLPYYKGELRAEWVRPERVKGLFSSQDGYMSFLSDYEDYKATLDIIKKELAHS